MPPQWLTPLKEQALSAFQRYTYLKIVLVVISGSGFFALLSDFATYNFALWYGFRIPVEGVPYLKMTVALLGLFTAVSVLLLYFSIYALLNILWFMMRTSNQISAWLDKFTNLKDSDSAARIERVMRELSNIAIIIISLSIAVAYYLIVTAVFYISDDCGDNGINCFNHGPTSFIYVLIVFLSLVMARPQWIKLIAGIASISVIFIILVYAFSPSKYAEFLRFAGFGGGKPISVYMLGVDSKSETKVEGGLLIRSNDYLTVYSERTQSSLEIPMALVRKIEYGNSNKNAILPQRNK